MKSPTCAECKTTFEKMEYLNNHMTRFHKETDSDRITRLTRINEQVRTKETKEVKAITDELPTCKPCEAGNTDIIHILDQRPGIKCIECPECLFMSNCYKNMTEHKQNTHENQKEEAVEDKIEVISI